MSSSSDATPAVDPSVLSWCSSCKINITQPTSLPLPLALLCPRCHRELTMSQRRLKPELPTSHSLIETSGVYPPIAGGFTSQLPRSNLAIGVSPPTVSSEFTLSPTSNSVITTGYPLIISRPASKSFKDGLMRIPVINPVESCPVCKEDYSVNSEASMMTCKHFFHSCCILSWLWYNNSCPVCRFRVPTEEDDARNRRKLEIEMLEPIYDVKLVAAGVATGIAMIGCFFAIGTHL